MNAMDTMDATAGVPQTPSAVDQLLGAITTARVFDLDVFTERVEVDATVPQWRFTVRGAAAVRARWYGHPGRFEELRRTPLPAGELVEFTLSWEEQGVPHAAHQAHVLELDEAGRIRLDRVWCGGRWPASLLAEMAEAGATPGGAGGAGA